MSRNRNSLKAHARTNHHVVSCNPSRFGVLGLGFMVYGIVAIRLYLLGCRRLVGIYVPIRGGDLRCVCSGVLELSIRDPSQKHTSVPAGGAFLREFEYHFWRAFCSKAGVPPAAAVAWYGNPRTSGACLYARDGGYLFSVSLKED